MTARRLALAILALSWPGAACATDIEVHVRDVAGSTGSVRALVFGQGNWLSDTPSYAGRVPAHPGEVVVVLHAVAPGTYGIVGHHDANDDGDVTRNFLGIPVEGIGFSNGVRIGLRAPRFNEAAIVVTGPRIRVDITLQFER